MTIDSFYKAVVEIPGMTLKRIGTKFVRVDIHEGAILASLHGHAHGLKDQIMVLATEHDLTFDHGDGEILQFKERRL